MQYEPISDAFWISFLEEVRDDYLADIKAIEIRDKAIADYYFTLDERIHRDAEIAVKKIYNDRIQAWNDWHERIAEQELEKNMASLPV